jgi:hypothetical protein
MLLAMPGYRHKPFCPSIKAANPETVANLGATVGPAGVSEGSSIDPDPK